MDSFLHIETKNQKPQARKNKNTKSMALRWYCETFHERQERLQDMPNVSGCLPIDRDTAEEAEVIVRSVSGSGCSPGGTDVLLT